MIGEVETLKDAGELLSDLRSNGHSVVLASSAKPSQIEHYVNPLDARSSPTDGPAPATSRRPSRSPTS